jgi:hypothetical protein
MFPSPERTANAFAPVFVPAKEAAGVAESGKRAANREGVSFLRTQNNAAVHAVGSGTCRLQCSLPEATRQTIK